MLKYLFYTENHVFGGGNKYMLGLIGALKDIDMDISIYCNEGGEINKFSSDLKVHYLKIFTRKYQSASRFFNKFIYLLSFFLDPFFLFLNTFYFLFLLRKEKFNKIIVCNGGYPAALSCLSMVFASKILKIPVVMSVVSMPALRRKFIRGYDKLLDYCVWHSIDSVVVNSLSIKNHLTVFRACPFDKIQIVYNGIKETQYKKFDMFQQENIVIGCIARMDYSKGVLVLLEAFNDVYKKYPNVKLILAGIGDAVEELRAKVRHYNLSNQVELLGFYEGNVDTLLSTIDIFVLCSFWEGLPYSIVEACRSARAIIATDVGGVSEIIENHYSGILLSSPSEYELSNAIKFLIGNPDAAREFGMNARRTYEKKFKLKAMHENAKRVLI